VVNSAVMPESAPAAEIVPEAMLMYGIAECWTVDSYAALKLLPPRRFAGAEPDDGAEEEDREEQVLQEAASPRCDEFREVAFHGLFPAP
jgi:hypothetical protein